MSVGAEGRTAPPPDPEVVKLKRWMDESLQLPRAIIIGLQDVIAQAGSIDVMETYALQVAISAELDAVSREPSFRLEEMTLVPGAISGVGAVKVKEHVVEARTANPGLDAEEPVAFVFFVYELSVDGEHRTTNTLTVPVLHSWVAETLAGRPAQGEWVRDLIRQSGASVADYDIKTAAPGMQGHAQSYVWGAKRRAGAQ